MNKAENSNTEKISVAYELEKSGPHPHILFIDNEEFLVKLWKRILERHGYKVTIHTDGNLALKDFKESPDSFDLIVTDQSMPSITGCKLAEELFKIRSDIKVIVCSGYLEDGSIEKELLTNIKEFLIKPFDNKTLINAIERNL